jgi:hypothetical protein
MPETNNSTRVEYTDHLNECIDTLSSSTTDHHQPRSDLRPLIFMHFQTKHGSLSPTTLTALLDSGGAQSLISKQSAKNLLQYSTLLQTIWTTPGGTHSTRVKTSGKFLFPEVSTTTFHQWQFHVTESLGDYDVLIGRDILNYLKIDIKFSNKEIVFPSASVPFKNSNATMVYPKADVQDAFLHTTICPPSPLQREMEVNFQIGTLRRVSYEFITPPHRSLISFRGRQSAHRLIYDRMPMGLRFSPKSYMHAAETLLACYQRILLSLDHLRWKSLQRQLNAAYHKFNTPFVITTDATQQCACAVLSRGEQTLSVHRQEHLDSNRARPTSTTERELSVLKRALHAFSKPLKCRHNQ